MSIRIVLADDHSIVRAGLAAILQLEPDMEILGEAATGMELLRLAKKVPADVFIVDISMPDLNGIEAIDQLFSVNPHAKALVLSMHDAKTFVEKAFRAGARGYILKEKAADEIVAAVREVHSGGYFITPRIQGFMVEGFLSKSQAPRRKTAADLTRQERRIIQLIAEGHSNPEIAAKLHIAVNTVHAHRNNLMKKLDIHKQAELIRYALREGLVLI